MPRQKIYKSAKDLERAINLYYKSRQTKVCTNTDDLRGQEISYSDFVIPPSITDLRLFLGLSKSTWANYASGANGADYKAVCEYARDVQEAWLHRELLTRRKGIEGIKFDLQCNYNWDIGKASEGPDAPGVAADDHTITLEDKEKALQNVPELLERFGLSADQLEDCGGSAGEGRTDSRPADDQAAADPAEDDSLPADETEESGE